MSRLWLLCTALVFAPATADSEPPGSPAGGLTIGVAVAAEQHELHVTVQNVGHEPLMLPLGNLIGSESYNFRFEVVVATPDGKTHSVIDTAVAVIAGRLDPLIIALVPKASYTVRLPLARFYVMDLEQPLNKMVRQPCRMQVELRVVNPVCPPYGYPNPNMIPCWQGKVVSNVLQFPQSSA